MVDSDIARTTLSLCAALAAALSLTAAPALAVPAAGTTPAGEVVIYDTASPGTIAERHAITGLQPLEKVKGLDVRPATGQLYALGILQGAQDTGRIYVIDPGTGVATEVGSAPFSTTLTTADWGFDFNPLAAVDRIRVVSRARQNLRVNPTNGQLAATDTNLGPGTPDVTAIAYDQNVAGTGQTTLFGYDFSAERVVRIGGFDGGPPENSPNGGVVTQLSMPSGITTADSGGVGMDIAPSGLAYMTAPTPLPSLYRVNLTSGPLTLVGAFPEAVNDVAVLQPSSFGLDGTSVAVPESNGHATITVTRSGNATGTQTVGYATSDGTATAADYTAASGTLTFGPGETSKTFAVPVTDDTADEPAETVSLSLSAPTGGSALGSVSTGTLTIIDDDPAPVVVPPDTVKPQLLLALPTTLRLRQALGGLRGRVSVSEACTLGLRMTLGTKVLGSAAPGTAALGVRAFRVKFTAAGAKALKKRLKTRRTASLSLRATCTDAAHNAGAATAGVRVTR